uniref:Uncharacterized protein n=1 Tax=Rhizophora mucronata TaxID=61149 RepID=A0A2P2MZA4_RHIMU
MGYITSHSHPFSLNPSIPTGDDSMSPLQAHTPTTVSKRALWYLKMVPIG